MTLLGLEKSMEGGREDPSWWYYARSVGISEETILPVFNELEVTRPSSRDYSYDRHVKGADFNGRMISKLEVSRIVGNFIIDWAI